MSIIAFQAGDPYCDAPPKSDQNDDEEECNGLWFLLSSEPVSAGILSQLGLSLLTVYTIFVLAIGSQIRLVFTGDLANTPYTELTSCERLWNLCSDIFTARQHSDFIRKLSETVMN